jgi:hypothetical protein
MVLFKKKSKTQNLEPELAALRQRAEALDAKRQAAEAELTAATEARQRHLVEGDLGDDKTAQALQDRVNIAASAVVGLEDAIALVQPQIADIERKIDAERTQAERHAAAEKLARDLDVIERALPLYLEAAQRLTDAVGAVGYWYYELGEVGVFLRSTKPQVETQGTFALQELRGMVEQIKSGAAPIPPAKPAEAAPVVQVERPATKTVFCLKSVKWRDPSNGRLCSALQYEDAELPQALADKALRRSVAVPLTDDRRKTLKNSRGGHHPNLNALDIIDLDALTEDMAPYLGPSDPVLHVANFTPMDRGEARVIAIPAGRAG